jgi:hypothetical protein
VIIMIGAWSLVPTSESLHDARLDVEFRVAELGHVQQLATKMQRYAGITAAAVRECR